MPPSAAAGDEPPSLRGLAFRLLIIPPTEAFTQVAPELSPLMLFWAACCMLAPTLPSPLPPSAAAASMKWGWGAG